LANLPEILVRGRIHDQQVTVQTAELSMAMKRNIARAQLDDLGLSPSEPDLDRHMVLGRMIKLGFTPDRDYLDWCDAWLHKLQAANRKAQLYAESLYSEVLSEYWLKACIRTSERIGWAAWARFLQSPLRGGAVASLWHRFVAQRLPT
jgi:hypothetical protein